MINGTLLITLVTMNIFYQQMQLVGKEHYYKLFEHFLFYELISSILSS
jgi:hypothetical protein